MSRTWFFSIIAIIFGAEIVTTPQLGFAYSCDSVGCHMRAVASPASCVLAAIQIAFVFLCPRKIVHVIRGEPVSIWDRAAGCLIDSTLAGSAIAPFAVLSILLAEAGKSGVFRWRVSSENLVLVNASIVVEVIAVWLVLILAYFYAHAVLGRQTAGQYVMGHRTEGVMGDGQKPAFWLNALLGLIGYVVWPVSVYLAVNRTDKAFWWNLLTHTDVVREV